MQLLDRLTSFKMEGGIGNRESGIADRREAYRFPTPDSRFPLCLSTQGSDLTFTLFTHPKGTGYNKAMTWRLNIL